MVYTMGENSPMASSLKTWVNLPPRAYGMQKSDFVAVFQNYYFTNILDVNMWREDIIDKVMKLY